MAKESASSTYRLIVILCISVVSMAALVFLSATLWLRRTPDAIPFDPQSAHTQWQTEIREASLEVERNPSAVRLRELREGLLMLRVTSEDRDTHLQFILALVALERGDENANELFIQARDAALK